MMAAEIDWASTLTVVIGAVAAGTASVVTAVVAAAVKVGQWRADEAAKQRDHEDAQKNKDRELALSLEQRNRESLLLAIQSAGAMGEKVVTKIDDLGSRINGKLTEQTATLAGKIQEQTAALKCGYTPPGGKP